jgi:hypothetical protein
MTDRGNKLQSETSTGMGDGCAVDLGPRLPLAVYTSNEVWNPQRIGAVAIYCSDGRWGDAFDEFCHRALHIPRYDRFAVPGGPAWFTRQQARSSGPYFAAREQLDFLVQVHQLERIVLVGHFGCAFYTEMLKCDPRDALPTQLLDLDAAGKTLGQWFPSLAIEAYFAMRQDNQITFHHV